MPLIVICGGTCAWFFLLPGLQGGERWEAANRVCPVLDTAVASRLGVAVDAEPRTLDDRDLKLPTSLCRYLASGDGSEAAGLEVAVTVTGSGQFEDAHERALAVVDENRGSLRPIGEQREDQIFGEPEVSIARLEMVTVVDNAAVEIEYVPPEKPALDGAAKSALRDPLQSVTDQAVANLG